MTSATARAVIALVLLVPLALLGGCPKPQETDTDSDVVPVNDGPALVHTLEAESLVQGQALTIGVTATDADTVEQVTLYFRTTGENAWETVYLEHGEGDTWSTELPANQITAPSLEYYFRAQDAADVPAVTYLPDNAAHPFVVDVGIVGLALPFVEDFEDSGLLGVFDLGWNVETDGFPAYPWSVDEVVKHGGLASAKHFRGTSEMPSGLDDWLITPALDLRSSEGVELSWYEYGDFADLGVHSVWVSTTTGDPDDGGFIKVVDLENPPEETWARSPVLDLSSYVGEDSGITAAWVAFRYEGDFTDAWWIDDVVIGPLTPEIDATGFDLPLAIVSPGDTVALGIDVQNVTAKASGALTVTWSADPAAGTFAGQPASEAALPGDGAATWTADFTVNPTWPDNTRVPFTVTATDGTETWSFTSSFLVGQPSSATIGMTWVTSGLLQLSIGAGDPASPTVEIPVVSDVVASGDHTYTVDLTEVADALPPAAGPDRWWLRVTGALSGRIEQFDVSYDGQTFVGDDLGTFPTNAEKLFWLPRPPVPVVTTWTVTPALVAPGASVDIDATLTNNGPSTVGVTTAQLESSDPAVTITSAPVELAADGWGTGVPAPVAFSLDVAATHVDSEPVVVDVVVTDDVESFVLPQSIAVPWPVLTVNAITITDAGDHDGLLDPGETATLAIALANVGDLSSSGTVRCVLSRSGGAATADVLVANGTFGTLNVGAQRTENAFSVAVTGGVAGDSLDFALACTDSSRAWTVPFVIDLGEQPWRALSVTPDPAGDNANGYAFDFVRGWWRTDGTTLDFRFDTAVPYDPTTLFIEAWANSAGGGYSNYQFVLQSGVLRLRGYDFGVFTTLAANPAVDWVDADTVVISWDLAPMQLLLDRLSIGFAAGFCGGETYYCDHYANGWGDPYQVGFDETRWFDLSW